MVADLHLEPGTEIKLRETDKGFVIDPNGGVAATVIGPLHGQPDLCRVGIPQPSGGNLFVTVKKPTPTPAKSTMTTTAKKEED